MKQCKSLGFDKVLPKLIQAGGKPLCLESHKLNFTLNKEELPQ